MIDNLYDHTPYTSKVHRGRHIDRFATIGHLLGLHVTAPSSARVLDIGCSTGEHLFPMAIEYPQAEFIGIDSSPEQIAEANRLRDILSISNVRFECRDISSLDSSFETFDYIICHGVYSWVSDDVRKEILEKCKALLKSNGVAYVSYNTYPGWHLRDSVRQMLFYYDTPASEPAARIKRAREVIEQLAGSTEYDFEKPHSILLHKELKRIQSEPDHYLLHEFLASDNKAFLFSEFANALEVNGLRCIGDSRFSRMSMNRLLSAEIPPLAFKNVMRLSKDAVSLEQTMDFLFFNVFRESLITHSERGAAQEILPESIRTLSFTSYLAPAGERPITLDSQEQEFTDLRGVAVTTANPLLKGAIKVLSEISPNYISYPNLLAGAVQAARRLDSSDTDTEVLTGALLEWAQKEVIDISLYPSRVAPTVYAHARTTSFIREAAQKSHTLTNLFYNTVEIGLLERELLPLLDGMQDKEVLIAKARYLISQGAGGIKEDGEIVTDPARQHELLDHLIESTLQTLQRAGLLLP